MWSGGGGVNGDGGMRLVWGNWRQQRRQGVVWAAVICFVLFNLLLFARLGRSATSTHNERELGASLSGKMKTVMTGGEGGEGGEGGVTGGGAIAGAAATRKDSSLWGHLSELVVVAGHSVYIHGDFETQDVVADHSWFLESFQRGQVKTFVSHIRRGVELAAQRPSSLLVFSGGETRLPAGPRSEAQSYWLVAEFSDWFGAGNDDRGQEELRTRAVTEEHARDSFENLLFSICRFREVTGDYPGKVTVVGFSFKKARFTELHRKALRFPADRFEYVGVDPETSQEALDRGELVNSLGPYSRDPYGCGTELQAKRAQRNPFHRSHGYHFGCPELRELLDYCGPDFFQGELPWD